HSASGWRRLEKMRRATGEVSSNRAYPEKSPARTWIHVPASAWNPCGRCVRYTHRCPAASRLPRLGDNVNVSPDLSVRRPRARERFCFRVTAGTISVSFYRMLLSEFETRESAPRRPLKPEPRETKASGHRSRRLEVGTYPALGAAVMR